MDNREWQFCAQYVDGVLTEMKNDVWNRLISMRKPVKMFVDEDHTYGVCPKCGKFFEPDHVLRKPHYCEDCGIAFDWENDEE